MKAEKSSLGKRCSTSLSESSRLTVGVYISVVILEFFRRNKIKISPALPAWFPYEYKKKVLDRIPSGHYKSAWKKCKHLLLNRCQPPNVRDYFLPFGVFSILTFLHSYRSRSPVALRYHWVWWRLCPSVFQLQYGWHSVCILSWCSWHDIHTRWYRRYG